MRAQNGNNTSVGGRKVSEQVLYTRWEHGSLPVRVHPRGFTLEKPSGPVQFKSARSLLKDIYGGDQHNWSLQRYFKIKPLKKEQPDVLSVLRMHPPEKQKTEKPKLGIDLQIKRTDVAKLLRSGFDRQIRSLGMDFEDALQEVYLGILVRNKGKCPWDVTKSSFGHYVYMICNCILSNLAKKRSKHRYNDLMWDVPVEGAQHPETCENFEALKASLSNKSDKAEEVLGLVIEGYTRGEIASRLGMEITEAAQMLSTIRREAKRVTR